MPGDIIELRLGDIVPADVRLLEVSGLECDESVLTGESLTVDKSNGAVAPGTPLAELAGCALTGTIVHAGSGRGAVVGDGDLLFTHKNRNSHRGPTRVHAGRGRGRGPALGAARHRRRGWGKSAGPRIELGKRAFDGAIPATSRPVRKRADDGRRFLRRRAAHRGGADGLS